MSEFKVIDTQEAFDAAISDRLKRDREKYWKQFEEEMKSKGWKSPDEISEITADLNKQIATLQNAAASTEKILAEKDAKIAEGEIYRTDLVKTRIALNAGLGIDQVGRLQGANEEEWEEDAKKLIGEFIHAFTDKHAVRAGGRNNIKINTAHGGSSSAPVSEHVLMRRVILLIIHYF